MVVVLDREVKQVESEIFSVPAHVNHIEILGVPLVVYPTKKEANVERNYSTITINFATPDLKVSVMKFILPEMLALASEQLSTQEGYNDFIAELATSKVVPAFEKTGIENVKQQIIDKVAEWDKNSKGAEE